METKENAGKIHTGLTCPVRDVMCRFGDKWSMLVLIALAENGTMRFNDLHRAISDVSQRMLTVTLRTLEADGLISRKVYAEVPPRVEYRLTEMGRSLMPHVDAIVGWAMENMPAIERCRRQSAEACCRKGSSTGGDAG